MVQPRQSVYGPHLGAAPTEALCAPVTFVPDREALRVTLFAITERHQVDQVSEHLARTGLAVRLDLV